MKRILLSSVGLIAAFAVIAPAFADEPPPPPRRAKPARVTREAPPPRAAEPARQQASSGKSWSGSQAGGSNGGSFANNSFVEPGSYICPPYSTLGNYCYETPFGFKESAPAYTFGGFLGYNIQFGSFVVGVEGDASYKKAESSVSRLTYSGFDPVYSGIPYHYTRSDNFTGTLKQGWDGSVRGRFGMLITPDILVYGTGGVAFGKVSGSLLYTGTISGDCGVLCGTAISSTTFSETRVGATGGAGIEFALIGPWTARLEYRYTDLGSFTKSFPVSNSGACTTGGFPTGCALSSGASIDLHPTFQTVRFGLSADPSQVLSQLFSGGY